MFSFEYFYSQCSSFCTAVYDFLIYQPVYRLYRYGPSVKGIGFMRGAPAAEVCASLTNVEAKFWLQHTEECDALISREVKSYIVLIETAMYFAFLLWLARSLSQCIVWPSGASSVERYWRRNSSTPKKRYFTPLRRSTPVRASRSSPLTLTK